MKCRFSSEGCPNNCHGNGDCQKSEEEWSCHCNDDWDGNDCSIPVEKDCDDGIDNDKGLYCIRLFLCLRLFFFFPQRFQDQYIVTV